MSIKSFLKFHYSIIPIFQTIVLITAIGCSSSTRFGKEDSDKKDNDKNYSVLETVEGVASYYSEEFHGRQTANGETYDMFGLTAAHKTYPFNTEVRVTNLSNRKSVMLRINDRMPGYKGRIIDVSFQAARELGMLISGVEEVKIDVLRWGK